MFVDAFSILCLISLMWNSSELSLAFSRDMIEVRWKSLFVHVQIMLQTLQMFLISVAEPAGFPI